MGKQKRDYSDPTYEEFLSAVNEDPQNLEPPTTLDGVEVEPFIPPQSEEEFNALVEEVKASDNIGNNFSGSADLSGGRFGIGDTNLDDDGVSLYQVPHLEDLRAQSQGGMRLLGNALTNFGIEAAAGVLNFAGTIMDFEQMGDLINGTEMEFSNFFTDAVNGAKDSLVQDDGAMFKIYQTKAAQQGFAPTDSTWWAKGAGTFGTSVGLMAPALAVGFLSGGALGAVGGAVAGATVSRYVENTMEAFEVTDRLYKDFIREGMPEEQAREKAGAQGRKVWIANSAMLPIDIAQFIMSAGTMKAASKMGLGMAKAIGKDAATQIPQEAFEEFYQHVTAEEAVSEGLGKSGFYDQGFTYRLGDYVRDEQAWNAAFWGGVGGGVFSAASPMIQKKMEKTALYNGLLNQFRQKGDAVQFEKTSATMAYSTALQDLENTGSLDKSISTLDAIAQDDKLEPEARDRVTSLRTDLEEINKEIPAWQDQGYSKAEIANLSKLSMERRGIQRARKQLDSEISDLESSMIENDAMTPGALEVKSAQTKAEALSELQRFLTLKERNQAAQEQQMVTDGKSPAEIAAFQETRKHTKTILGQLKKDVPAAAKAAEEAKAAFIESEEFNNDVDTLEGQTLSTIENKYFEAISRRQQEDYALGRVNRDLKKAGTRSSKKATDQQAETEKKKTEDAVKQAAKDESSIEEINKLFKRNDPITYTDEEGNEVKGTFQGTSQSGVAVKGEDGVTRPIAKDKFSQAIEEKQASLEGTTEDINKTAREKTNESPGGWGAGTVEETAAPSSEAKGGWGEGTTEGATKPEADPTTEPEVGVDNKVVDEAHRGPGEVSTTPENKSIASEKKRPTTIAWISANNPKYSGEQHDADNKATTEFFEADNTTEGLEARVVISNEIQDWDTQDSPLDVDDVDIQLNVLDDQGNEIKINDGQVRGWVHKTNFEGYKTEAQKKQIRTIRQNMIDAVRAGNEVRVKLGPKKGGQIWYSSEVNTLEDIFKKSYEDINVYVVDNTGQLMPGNPIVTAMPDHTGKIAVVFEGYDGQLIAATGGTAKYTPALADAAMIVLRNATNYLGKSTITPKLAKYLREHESTEVSDVGTIFNLDPTKGDLPTLNELLNFFVVEGSRTEGNKNALKAKKGEGVTYVSNGKTRLIDNKSTPEETQMFKEHLLSLGFPVQAQHVQTPAGRKWYYQHGIYNFKLKPTAKGVPIHTPTIHFSENIEAIAPKEKATQTSKASSMDSRMDEVKAVSQTFSLSKDEKKYTRVVDGKTLTYERVTQFYKGESTEKTPKPVMISGGIIGDKNDEIWRAFFNGEIKTAEDIRKYKFQKKSIKGQKFGKNLTDAQLETFLNRLKALQTDFEKQGMKVLATDVVVFDDVEMVAGTVDLLLYNDKGDVWIYDMKAMKGNKFTEHYGKDPNTKYNATFDGGMSDKEAHSNQLSAYRALLHNAYGMTASKLAILPTVVSYNPGDTDINFSDVFGTDEQEIRFEVLNPYPVAIKDKVVHHADSDRVLTIRKGKVTKDVTKKSADDIMDGLLGDGYSSTLDDSISKERQMDTQTLDTILPYSTRRVSTMEETITGLLTLGDADVMTDMYAMQKAAAFGGSTFMQEFGSKVKVIVRSGREMSARPSMAGKDASRTIGIYEPETNQVVMNKDLIPYATPNMLARTLLHEFGHAGTIHVMHIYETDRTLLSGLAQDYVSTFYEMYDNLQLTDSEKAKTHALKSPQEFVAEFFGNQKFRQWSVERLVANNEKATGNILRRLFTFFKELFRFGFKAAIKAQRPVTADQLMGEFDEAFSASINDIRVAARGLGGYYAQEVQEPGEATPSELDAQETNEVLDFMQLVFFTQLQGAKSSVVNLSLDFGQVREKLATLSEEAEASIANVFKRAVLPENYAILVGRLNDRLRQAGIVINEEAESSMKEMGEYDKASFTINRKQNANLDVKLMVASLPEMDAKVDSEGNYTYTAAKGELLGLGKLAPANATWYAIQHLLKNLTITEGNSDVYSTMREKIRQFTPFYPSLAVLGNWLDNAPEYRRTQFMKAFNLQEITFILYQFNGYGKDLSVRRMDTTSVSKRNNLLEMWKNGFTTAFFQTNEKNEVKLTSNAKIAVERFNELAKETSRLRKGGKLPKEHLADWATFLKDSGIGIDPRTLEYGATLRNESNPADGLQQLINTTFRYVFAKSNYGNPLAKLVNEGVSVDENGDIPNPIKHADSESSLKSLVELEMMFRPQMNESTVLGADGDSYWVFQTYDYTNLLIDELKANPKMVDSLLQIPYHKHSSILKLMQKYGTDIIKVDTWNNARRMNAADKGTKYSRLERPDDLLLKMWGYTKGVLPYINQADKSRHYEISLDFKKIKERNGGKEVILLPETAMRKDGTWALGRSVPLMASLFLNELNASRLAWEQVFGDNKLPDNELIEDYHFVRDESGNMVKTLPNGLPTGSVFYSDIFPELSPGTGLAVSLDLYDSNGRPNVANSEEYYAGTTGGGSKLIPSFQKAFEPLVLAKILREKNRLLQIAEDDGLIEKTDSGYDNLIIPEELITESGTLENLFMTVAARSIYANAEITSLFYGDRRVFSKMKKDSDGAYMQGVFSSSLSKRVTGATAVKGRLRIDGKRVRKTYKAAVIADMITFSDKLLSEEHLREVAKATGESFSAIKRIFSDQGKTKNEQTGSGYDNNNAADAQAWITLDRAKEIFEGEGLWDDQMEDAYESLKAGKLKQSDVKLFSKAVNLAPQKGAYFAPMVINNQRVSVMDKYSQAILYPGLTKGTGLDGLRLAMERKVDGQNAVDEVITRSGSKGAVQKVATIFDSDGNMLDQATIEKELFTTDRENKHWGRQVEMSPKALNDNTLVNTQVRKNVFANVDREYVYESGRKGGEILAEKNAVISELSNRGLAEVSALYGTDPDGRFSEPAIRKVMRDEMVANNAPQDLIDSLDGTTNLNALPQDRKTLWYRIAAGVVKNTVKLKQLGGGFIQMSIAGISDTTEAGVVDLSYLKDLKKLKEMRRNIIWLKDRKDLDPPMIKDGKLIPGQILLPYKFLNLVGGDVSKIDKKLLNMIGYRIPNQGDASTDLLEVVGFLPEEYGDTVIAYAEITEKTGSDFDIDKMYIMAPNFTMTEEGLIKTPYNEGTSKDDVKARYEIYSKTLATKHALYAELDKVDFWNHRSNLVLDAVKEILNAKFAKNDNALAFIAMIDSTEYENSSILDSIKSSNNVDILSFEEFAKLPVTEQITTEALQNRFMDIMTEVLSEPSGYINMMTPLEYRTAAIKKDLNQVLEESNSTRDIDAYGLSGQIDSKYAFAGGKAQLGEVMNFLQDHSVRREVGRFIKAGLIDLKAVETRLDGRYDENGVPLMQIFSAYASLHVDIATDPIIIRANWSQDTTKVGLLMLAAGLPYSKVDRILNQPIIREYTKNKRRLRAKSTTPIKNSNGKKLSAFEVAALKFNEGQNINEKDLPVTAPSMLTNKVLTSQLQSTGNEQLGILGLYKLYEDNAKELTRGIQNSKVDSSPPKHLVDAYVKADVREKIQQHDTIGNWDQTFDQTFLGTMWKNSVTTLINGLQDIAIEGTPAFQTAMKEFMHMSGQDVSVDAVEQFMEELYGAFASGSSLSLTDAEFQRIFIGSQSVAHKTVEYQQPGSPLYGNVFIQYLNPSIKTGDHPSIVTIDNNNQISNDVINNLRNQWVQLYRHEDPAIRAYASDLAKAAYHTSNFRYSTRSMLKLLPDPILQDLGYTKYVEEAISGKLQESNYLLPMINQVYKHLSDNSSLVPFVPFKDMQTVPVANEYKDYFHKSRVALVDVENNPKLVIKSDGKDLLPNMKPFISTKLKTGSEEQGNRRQIDATMMFVGVTNSKGRQKAIYVRTNTLGYFSEGKRVTEYSFFESGKTSKFSKNNVLLSKEQRGLIGQFLKESAEIASRVQEDMTFSAERRALSPENEENQKISKFCSTS